MVTYIHDNVFSFVELASGDNNQQGLITRFYGFNENISILASSKSRMNYCSNIPLINLVFFF